MVVFIMWYMKCVMQSVEHCLVVCGLHNEYIHGLGRKRKLKWRCPNWEVKQMVRMQMLPGKSPLPVMKAILSIKIAEWSVLDILQSKYCWLLSNIPGNRKLLNMDPKQYGYGEEKDWDPVRKLLESGIGNILVWKIRHPELQQSLY